MLPGSGAGLSAVPCSAAPAKSAVGVLVEAGNRGVKLVNAVQLRRQLLKNLVGLVQLVGQAGLLRRNQAVLLGDIGIQGGFDIAVGTGGEGENSGSGSGSRIGKDVGKV